MICLSVARFAVTAAFTRGTASGAAKRITARDGSRSTLLVSLLPPAADSSRYVIVARNGPICPRMACVSP
jgi:hypothetical protein